MDADCIAPFPTDANPVSLIFVNPACIESVQEFTNDIQVVIMHITLSYWWQTFQKKCPIEHKLIQFINDDRFYAHS